MAGVEEKDQDLHGKDNQQEQDGSLKNASGFFNGDSSQNHQYLQRTCINGGAGVASDFGHHQYGILNNNNATTGFFNGDSSLHRHILETINNGGTGLVSDSGDHKDGILNYNNGAAGFSNHLLLGSHNNGGTVLVSDIGFLQDGRFDDNVATGATGFFNGDTTNYHCNVLGSGNNGGTALVSDIGVVEDERFDDKVVGAATGFFNGELCQHNLGRSNNNGGVGVGVEQSSHDPQGGRIRLSLKKSPSFLNLIQTALNKEMLPNFTRVQFPSSQKLKASNFPANSLEIGNWKWTAKNEGDLVAKIYYAKKKLMWELLFGSLKKKIEISWSKISAIHAFISEGENGRLVIELSRPPRFAQEINSQPRRHTEWAMTTDFTGGQAIICRRHTIDVSPGVLDKHLNNLLQCDNRLLNLFQQPFLANNSPFFQNTNLNMSSNIKAVGYSPFPVANNHQQVSLPHARNIVQTTSLFVRHFSSSLQLSSLSLGLNFSIQRMSVALQQTENNQIQANSLIPVREQDHVTPYHGPELWFEDRQLELLLKNVQPRQNCFNINSTFDQQQQNNGNNGGNGLNQVEDMDYELLALQKPSFSLQEQVQIDNINNGGVMHNVIRDFDQSGMALRGPNSWLSPQVNTNNQDGQNGANDGGF